VPLDNPNFAVVWDEVALVDAPPAPAWNPPEQPEAVRYEPPKLETVEVRSVRGTNQVEIILKYENQQTSYTWDVLNVDLAQKLATALMGWLAKKEADARANGA
jgi:hypothetical protein